MLEREAERIGHKTWTRVVGTLSSPNGQSTELQSLRSEGLFRDARNRGSLRPIEAKGVLSTASRLRLKTKALGGSLPNARGGTLDAARELPQASRSAFISRAVRLYMGGLRILISSAARHVSRLKIPFFSHVPAA